MCKKMILLMALMAFLFESQSQAMDDNKDCPEFNGHRGRSTSSSPFPDSSQQSKQQIRVVTNIKRLQKRPTQNFTRPKQFSESGEANDKDLVHLVQQHVNNHFYLFSKQGLERISNFLEALKSKNGLLLRDYDTHYEALESITDSYNSLLTFITSEIQDDVRSQEEELIFIIGALNSPKTDLKNEGKSIYEMQYESLEIILSELTQQCVVQHKNLLDLDGKSSGAIEATKNSVKIFQNFFKNYLDLICKIKDERYHIIESLKNQYTYLPTIDSFTKVIAKYEGIIEKRKAEEMSAETPPDSKISGSSSSPKSSDGNKGFK